ncbi:MAG: type II and III secretion system protein [Ignavibacteriaceae bacterium]|nr:type II and III secretion system protein [Ignavibacteriaceae bacterium]
MRTYTLTLVTMLLLISQVFSQQYWERRFKTYTNPDELVTLSQTLPFNQAIELLSKVSESTTGKRIVCTVDREDPIGIEIENMPYDKALLIVVQYNGFIYEEKEDVIVVKIPGVGEIPKSPDTYASVGSREVKISAVFFEMDVNESKKRGIDWKFLLSGQGFNFGSEIISETKKDVSAEGGGGQSQGIPPNWKLGSGAEGQIGNFFGQATAMFQFFESENMGEILASPNIVVRDRNQGRIQIGSDFSVRTRDFAGNTVERFFPTGTIIEVTPYVYNEEGVDYILLNIMVERSSFTYSELVTEIKKSTATTTVLMLNGEESVMGGLFVNEETTSRNGIPFLRDLPWWVFGIRYLTGSDIKTITKKELVILLKAEIVPTLKERLENPTANNLIQQQLNDNQKKVKFYQLEQSDSQTKY